MGRSHGGLTSKVHAVVDPNGLPVRLGLSPGEAHDNRLCPVLLAGLLPKTMVLAAIDVWRTKEPDLSDRPDAIRRLVEKAIGQRNMKSRKTINHELRRNRRSRMKHGTIFQSP